MATKAAAHQLGSLENRENPPQRRSAKSCTHWQWIIDFQRTGDPRNRTGRQQNLPTTSVAATNKEKYYRRKNLEEARVPTESGQPALGRQSNIGSQRPKGDL
uniref:Uncharacterized protein n=1 Tax=Opuntia streptacantha TaxID=393608 RepID=A0A7C9D3I8_OPUST